VEHGAMEAGRGRCTLTKRQTLVVRRLGRGCEFLAGIAEACCWLDCRCYLTLESELLSATPASTHKHKAAMDGLTLDPLHSCWALTLIHHAAVS
jgi:hypothetical protein